MSQAAHTVELDEHLKAVVQALHSAVGYAMPHTGEPEIADKAIEDCKEILDTIMEGHVSQWIKN